MGIGAGERADECRLASGEQNAAQRELVFADSIGKKAELTNADESGGQHVEQETADELDRVQGHGLGPAVIGVILGSKADPALFEC